jgi:hypothetical protein
MEVMKVMEVMEVTLLHCFLKVICPHLFSVALFILKRLTVKFVCAGMHDKMNAIRYPLSYCI